MNATRNGILLSALLALTPAWASAQANARASVLADGQLFVTSARRVVSAPARWNRRDWLGVAAAAGTIGAAALLDDAGRDFMTRHQSERAEAFSGRIENLGTITNYRVLSALYLGGLLVDDEKMRAVAVESVVSSVIAGAVITPTLQTALGRKRPRANQDPYTFEPFGGGHSFPSGHTTQAFAVASVIALEYPRTWVKLVSYGTAAAVGATRMYNGAHFVSDVVAGALLGHAVARAATVARGPQSVDVQPFSDGASLGVRVRF